MCVADPTDRPETGPADLPVVEAGDGHRIPVRRFRPGGEGAAPGGGAGTVLVLSDMFGWGKFYQRLCDRLTSDGFDVAMPDLFSRSGELAEKTLPAALDRLARTDGEELLADLTAVISVLGAEGGRVATLGFCFGGTLALRLATACPAATVAFYGFPGDDGSSDHDQSPLALAPRMHAPILGLWGDQDEHIPVIQVQALDEELTRHGIPHDFRIYPGEGHNFLGGLFARDGSTPASLDAYRRATSLLDEALRKRS